VVCLGAFAWDAALRVYGISRNRSSATTPRRRPATATILGCYHPSQQNTFTGVLTPEMLDAALLRARALISRG
jgi:uracil-DNA glycosylase